MEIYTGPSERFVFAAAGVSSSASAARSRWAGDWYSPKFKACVRVRSYIDFFVKLLKFYLMPFSFQQSAGNERN